MISSKALIISFVMLVAVLFVLSTNERPPKELLADDGTSRSHPARIARWETKVDSSGPVEVTVTPKALSEAESWQFSVRLETHSVELDNDLVASSVMRNDSGIEYRPLRWEGDPPGGHHRSGVLFFDAPDERPQIIRLSIRGVGGVPERLFEWQLNP